MPAERRVDIGVIKTVKPRLTTTDMDCTTDVTFFYFIAQAAVDKWGVGSSESEAEVDKYLSGEADTSITPTVDGSVNRRTAHASRTRYEPITPLAAAAFRSNWVLFRKIYDEYENRTDQRWPRDKVRFSSSKTEDSCLLLDERQASLRRIRLVLANSPFTM